MEVHFTGASGDVHPKVELRRDAHLHVRTPARVRVRVRVRLRVVERGCRAPAAACAGTGGAIARQGSPELSARCRGGVTATGQVASRHPRLVEVAPVAVVVVVVEVVVGATSLRTWQANLCRPVAAAVGSGVQVAASARETACASHLGVAHACRSFPAPTARHPGCCRRPLLWATNALAVMLPAAGGRCPQPWDLLLRSTATLLRPTAQRPRRWRRLLASPKAATKTATTTTTPYHPQPQSRGKSPSPRSVSYTHLTLPTIYSV